MVGSWRRNGVAVEERVIERDRVGPTV